MNCAILKSEKKELQCHKAVLLAIDKAIEKGESVLKKMTTKK